MIIFDKISLNQNVPVVLQNFWLSTINKIPFQVFYVEWLTTDTNTPNLCTSVHDGCQLGMLLYSQDSTAHTRKLMTG